MKNLANSFIVDMKFKKCKEKKDEKSPQSRHKMQGNLFYTKKEQKKTFLSLI